MTPSRLKFWKVFQRSYFDLWFDKYNSQPWACGAAGAFPSLQDAQDQFYKGTGPASASPGNFEQSSGHNVFTTYLGGSANLRSSSEYVVIRGKMPQVTRTLSGDKAPTVSSQLRYFNVTMQTGEPIALSSVIDLTDENVVLDSDGDYAIVIGETKPANAVPENSITWVPWTKGQTLSINVRVLTEPGAVGSAPWTNSPVNLGWTANDYCQGSDPGTGTANHQNVRTTMGAYYPSAEYLSTSAVSLLNEGAPSYVPDTLSETDINAPAAGETSYAAATRLWTLAGAGSLAAGATSDTGHFANTDLVNTGSVTVRLGGAAALPGATAAVGLMLRESTATAARQVFIGWHNGTCRFGYRTATGGANTLSTVAGCAALPGWFSITRSGNTFSFYHRAGETGAFTRSARWRCQGWPRDGRRGCSSPRAPPRSPPFPRSSTSFGPRPRVVD